MKSADSRLKQNYHKLAAVARDGHVSIAPGSPLWPHILGLIFKSPITVD